MSHYAEYLAEREKFKTFEDDYGFATFIVHNNECYLRDVYVAPAYRKTGKARDYVDHVFNLAREMGATRLVTSICVDAIGASESMAVALNLGFQLQGLQGSMIYLGKEIL